MTNLIVILFFFFYCFAVPFESRCKFYQFPMRHRRLNERKIEHKNKESTGKMVAQICMFDDDEIVCVIEMTKDKILWFNLFLVPNKKLILDPI